MEAAKARDRAYTSVPTTLSLRLQRESLELGHVARFKSSIARCPTVTTSGCTKNRSKSNVSHSGAHVQRPWAWERQFKRLLLLRRGCSARVVELKNHGAWTLHSCFDLPPHVTRHAFMGANSAASLGTDFWPTSPP